MNRNLISFLIFVCCLLPSAYANPLSNSVGISTAHPLATESALNILENGGNAFDAAIAASAVLAVVEPYSSGIGGGGFWLLHKAEDNSDIMIDGRETAPEKSTADMYLDEAGNVIKGLSINGALAAGIPGEPAALAFIAEHFGKLPLTETLKDAIRLSKEGFMVDEYYKRMVGFRLESLRSSKESAKIFLDNNNIPEIGYLIKQPDLATTLTLLAEKGRDGFYKGEVANKLVAGVQQAGGIWTKEDLANYQIKVRDPIVSFYKGMKITSAALPSSGGIVLSQIFNVLSGYKLHELNRVTKTH